MTNNIQTKTLIRKHRINTYRLKWLLIQKLVAIIFIILALISAFYGYSATTLIDKDIGSIALFFFPNGIWLLTTNKIIKDM